MPYPYEANLNDAKRLLKDRRYPEAALQFYKAATQGSREAWEILNGEILFEEQGFEDDVNNGDHDYQLCIALIHLIGWGCRVMISVLMTFYSACWLTKRNYWDYRNDEMKP